MATEPPIHSENAPVSSGSYPASSSTDDRVVLVIDAGSPVASLALCRAGEVLAERSGPGRTASETLLLWLDDCLQSTGIERRELEGIAALSGPGSFTGLRIGLATALGLTQALRLPGTGIPTLCALAAAGNEDRPCPERVVAVVDALRGEWFCQSFSSNLPVSKASEIDCLDHQQVLALGPARIVGFGLETLRQAAVPLAAGERASEIFEPGPLAPVVGRRLLNEATAWDTSALSRPLYFRQPAVTPRRTKPL